MKVLKTQKLFLNEKSITKNTIKSIGQLKCRLVGKNGLRLKCMYGMTGYRRGRAQFSMCFLHRLKHI